MFAFAEDGIGARGPVCDTLELATHGPLFFCLVADVREVEQVCLRANLTQRGNLVLGDLHEGQGGNLTPLGGLGRFFCHL